MAKSDLLPLGKYMVVEVSNENSDYIIDTTEHHIELSEIDNRTAIVYQTLNLTNKLKKGKLVFSKTDLINGDAIPNTIINVFTEDDLLVFSGKTNDKGEITIDNLKAGMKYYIQEVEPNSNYVITDEIVYFRYFNTRTYC